MNKDLIDNIFSFLFSIIFNKEQHNMQCKNLLNIKNKTNDESEKQKISILKHLSKKFN